ncbi:MAG: TetR/AcrR family transcriptional regulator [Chloroflexota bacterium]
MSEKGNSYHHGDLRNRLIAIGVEILASDGLATLSLRKVSRQAGVSHAAAYRHFANKEALLAAIAKEGFRKLTAQLKRFTTEFSGEPRHRLLGSGQLYTQFALEHPHHLQVMFGDLTHELYPALNLASQDAFMELVGVVETCQNDGDVVEEDAELIALSLWAMFHGLAVIMIADKLPSVLLKRKPQEKIAQEAIEKLYEGLAKKSRVVK